MILALLPHPVDLLIIFTGCYKPRACHCGFNITASPVWPLGNLNLTRSPHWVDDPTVYCISSWNDHGWASCSTRFYALIASYEPACRVSLSASVDTPGTRLQFTARRTSWVCTICDFLLYVAAVDLAVCGGHQLLGLGWLLSRRIFEEELLPKWPSGAWDLWAREDAQRKG